MPAIVEIAVGRPSAEALALTDFEAAEELTDAISSLLTKQQTVEIALVRPAGATPEVASAMLSLPVAFEAVLNAASHFDSEHCVHCFVASEAVRARLTAIRRSEAKDVRRYVVGGWNVVVSCGDITTIVADAIVNASNTRLVLGGGVSGALHRACGPGLQAEMNRLGTLAEDGIVATGAHNLRTTSTILHVPTASGRSHVIRRALDNVLRYCRAHHLTSVAIPALGTGTGGLDVECLAEHCLAALTEAVPPDKGCTVAFVLWDDLTFAAFKQVFDRAQGAPSV